MEKRKYYLILIYILVSFSLTAEQEDFLAPVIETAEEIIESEMESANIPGVVFVVIKDGEIYLQKAYGYADVKTWIPMDPSESVLRIGSISKVLTAAGALRLKEKGKLDFSADINEYISDLHIEGMNGQPITLHQLLTYSAGIDPNLWGSQYASSEEAKPLEEFLKNTGIKTISEPGQRSIYSSLSISLAGYVLEQASNLDFGDYMRHAVFLPLGMESSSADMLPPSILRDNLAVGHSYQNGEYIAYPFDYTSQIPGFGMLSTGTDMARFLIALTSPEKSEELGFLSAKSISEMLRLQYTNHALTRGWGYAFNLSRNQQYLYKDGQVTGFTSRIMIFPDMGVSFFICQNRTVFDERFGGTNRSINLKNEISDLFINALNPAEIEASSMPQPLSRAAERVSLYLGSYRNCNNPRERWSALVINSFDQFSIQKGPNGTILLGKTPYVETSAGVFSKIDGSGPPLVFEIGKNGKASGVYLGASVAERISWYQTKIFFFVFLTFQLLLFITLVVRINRKKSSFFLKICTSALGLKMVFLLVIFVKFLGTTQSFFLKPSSLFLAMFILPILGLALDVTVLGMKIKELVVGKQVLLLRNPFEWLILVPLIGFSVFFIHWNLVGFPSF